MNKQNVFGRLRCVANVAALGAITMSIFFGWIDRSVDWHPIGAILGASIASLRLFHSA